MNDMCLLVVIQWTPKWVTRLGTQISDIESSQENSYRVGKIISVEHYNLYSQRDKLGIFDTFRSNNNSEIDVLFKNLKFSYASYY